MKRGFVFQRIKIVGKLYFYVRLDTTDLGWPMLLLSQKDGLFFDAYGLTVHVEAVKQPIVDNAYTCDNEQS